MAEVAPRASPLVDASQVLADHEDVGIADVFGLQRAGSKKRGMRTDRRELAEEAKRFAELINESSSAWPAKDGTARLEDVAAEPKDFLREHRPALAKGIKPNCSPGDELE
jgi:hypothetical protein